ncbi:putative ABC transporter permease [Bacillus sp. JJ1764]|uniref:putative ABC transporter permease n=1 Tax=Bacillus sp. JJ1764 TaxID=3122964 RepID=UPI002FFEAF92
MIISLLDGFKFQTPVFLNLQGAAALMFYFTLYSFFGWLLENGYNFFTRGEWTKPNFLYGPFKPMYGFAPLVLVLFITSKTHWAVVLLLCLFIPTIVEYVSGALLYKLFNRRWWDYTETPLQLHGHICLPFSLCWVALSVIFLKWIHPTVESVYELFEPFWTWIWTIIALYFIADLVLTIRRHTLQNAITNEEPTNPIQ